MTDKRLETILEESRKFPPPENFQKDAHISSFADYQRMHTQSVKDPEGFWGSVADELTWHKKWDQVLDDSEAPFYKWFAGGKTNVTENCLDRHLTSATRNKAAIIWEGEPGEQRVLTYWDLWREVNKCAHSLKELGISKGDRVAIYLPMVPELAVTMLACARIGAVHSIIFAGFSSESIRDRVLDCQAKLVITADGGWRRGKVLPLKDIVDEALKECDCVDNVIVVKRSPGDPFPCHFHEGRDHWYNDLMDKNFVFQAPEQMDSAQRNYPHHRRLYGLHVLHVEVCV
jgi:acetyl-CoA synthetase